MQILSFHVTRRHGQPAAGVNGFRRDARVVAG